MASKGDVFVDPALTDISIAFGKNTYVADKLFPPVKVMKDGGLFYRIDVAREANRDGVTHRAPGTVSTNADITYTTDTYAAIDHSKKVPVPDEVRTNADTAIGPEQDAAETATEKVLIGKEIAAAATIVSDVTAQALSKGAWNLDTSDPITDIANARKAIIGSVQRKANVLTVSEDTFITLQNHPLIKEMVKYGGTPSSAATVSAQAIAAVFGVERVEVSLAYKNTAAFGATASMSDVWGGIAVLAFVPPRPSLRTMSLGYTFGFDMGPGFTKGQAVRRWRDDPAMTDWIDYHYYYDQKVVQASCARRFASVLG